MTACDFLGSHTFSISSASSALYFGLCAARSLRSCAPTCSRTPISRVSNAIARSTRPSPMRRSRAPLPYREIVDSFEISYVRCLPPLPKHNPGSVRMRVMPRDNRSRNLLEITHAPPPSVLQHRLDAGVPGPDRHRQDHRRWPVCAD